MKCKRTLVEEPTFSTQLAALGDVRRLDEALRALTWALHENAEHYPIIRGTKRLRVAKTDGYGATPCLRVFFTIEVTEIGTESVHLWFVDHDVEGANEPDGEAG